MTGRSKKTLAIGAIVMLTTATITMIGRVRSKPEPIYQGQPVSYWMRELSGTNFATRSQAFQVFRRRDIDAVPFLAKAVEAHESVLDQFYRVVWLKGLRRLPGGLVTMLPSPRPDNGSIVRLMAIQSLAQLGPSAAEAVPAVIAATVDKDASVRLAAANFLLAMEPHAMAPLSTLIRIVKDRNEGVAWVGLSLLGKSTPKSPKAIRAVAEALKHESFRVRGKAAITLGQLGPVARASVPALKAALNDEYWNVREAAAEALKKIEADSI